MEVSQQIGQNVHTKKKYPRPQGGKGRRWDCEVKSCVSLSTLYVEYHFARLHTKRPSSAILVYFPRPKPTESYVAFRRPGRAGTVDASYKEGGDRVCRAQHVNVGCLSRCRRVANNVLAADRSAFASQNTASAFNRTPHHQRLSARRRRAFRVQCSSHTPS